MRKSGSTRGSPNLVILRLRKVVSLRKIKFLQKGTFGKTLGVPVWYRPKALRCLSKYGFSKYQITDQAVAYRWFFCPPLLGIGVSLYRPWEACLCWNFRCGTVEAGREHDTCPRSKVSRCLGFGRLIAEGPAVLNVDFVHASGGHWSLIYVVRQILNSYCKASGQIVNLEKSNLFFSPNTLAEVKEEKKASLNVIITDDPGKYLGLPTIRGR
ncbi:hypothetical protein L3X38_018203 [Prunus dulcis]|uniref:Uncharacterized protein n=1 Tax=Prunus dulcis TaxID=3755 RepID=A0AAD4ZAT0_PRUDU|nr:hypothetical protein L3X38_018203 [Prunus dulcis]